MLISIDLLLVVLHIRFGQVNGFFNLDWERNLPALYQSFKLLLAGAVFIAHAVLVYAAHTREKRNTVMLFSLGALLLLLGLDEAAEIHESLPLYFGQLFPALQTTVAGWAQAAGYQSSIWIIYAIIVGMIIFLPLLWLARQAYRYFGQHQFGFLLALGVVYLFGAVGVEFIATRDAVFFSSSYQNWLIVEELLEMVAISLLFVFALRGVAGRVSQVRAQRHQES